MKVKFTIPGKPKAKQRPRVTRTGIAYTPKETVQYENLAKLMYVTVASGKEFDGNVLANITAYFPIPKGTPKKTVKGMLEGNIRPAKKPDTDNIAKIILDSLNGLAYHDDSQVVELRISKLYAEEPRVEVELEDIVNIGDPINI